MLATGVDSLLAAEAVGVRRLGALEQVRSDDRFHLGSLTKAITATMIATLVEEGALSWESRITEVFPEWADSIHPEMSTVMLDQLLRHAAGVAPYEDDGAPEYRALPDLPENPIEQRRAFARIALQRAPLFAPGTARRYSNGGYVIAAAMAERVTARSWESLVQDRVFRPLGMQSAGFGWPADADRAEPWGHVPAEGGDLQPLDPADVRLPAWHRPAGDISLSAQDYGRFLREHLRGLRGVDGLLQAGTVKYLHTPAGESPNALGWGVREVGGRLRSSHNGGTGCSTPP